MDFLKKICLKRQDTDSHLHLNWFFIPCFHAPCMVFFVIVHQTDPNADASIIAWFFSIDLLSLRNPVRFLSRRYIPGDIFEITGGRIR